MSGWGKAWWGVWGRNGGDENDGDDGCGSVLLLSADRWL